jgi:hypothetical protein
MHKRFWLNSFTLFTFAFTPLNAIDAQDLASRMWRDVSGVFVLEAQLTELSPSHAKLRKEDGGVIAVRRDSLSKDDQSYLFELDKKSNPFAGTLSMANPVQPIVSKTLTKSALTGEASSTQLKPN